MGRTIFAAAADARVRPLFRAGPTHLCNQTLCVTQVQSSSALYATKQQHNENRRRKQQRWQQSPPYFHQRWNQKPTGRSECGVRETMATERQSGQAREYNNANVDQISATTTTLLCVPYTETNNITAAANVYYSVTRRNSLLKLTFSTMKKKDGPPFITAALSNGEQHKRQITKQTQQ